MQPWNATVLCPGYSPRQFEYHPTNSSLMVFGTITGQAVVVNHSDNKIVGRKDSYSGEADSHSILGLSWLKHQPNRFVMGSADGSVSLCDIRNAIAAYKSEYSCTELDAVTPPEIEVVQNFTSATELTSTHTNADDTYAIISGYSRNVTIYDLSTGESARVYENIHRNHINITRFSNMSPTLFATSSFDKTVKLWDTRMDDSTPIYTCESDAGHIMLCFSPDDRHLLTSACDNEIRQFSVVDGSEVLKLSMATEEKAHNYTRAYYMNEGQVIVSGSSEEKIVRLHSANTGKLISEAEMYPGRQHSSLYIQSLRGDPHQRDNFSVLVNYKDAAFPLEIVKIDPSRDIIGNPVSDNKRSLVNFNYELMADFSALSPVKPASVLMSEDKVPEEDLDTKNTLEIFPTSNKNSEHENFCKNINCAMDTVIIGNNGSVNAHAVILSARSLYLSGVVQSCISSGSGIISVNLPFNITVLRIILLYIYTARISPIVATDITVFPDVIHAAGLLQLPRLASLCEWYCIENLKTSNIVQYLEVSHNFSIECLKERCIFFANDNMVAIDINVLPSELLDKVRAKREVSKKSKPLDKGSGLINPLGDSRTIAEKFVPCFTGQSCVCIRKTADSLGQILILGGGNRTSLISFENVLEYSICSSTWSKTNCSGTPPKSLIHHACTNFSLLGKEYVLVFGGSYQNQSFNSLYALDVCRMDWSIPQASGVLPSPRTGHTLNYIGDQYNMLSRKVTDETHCDYFETKEERNAILFGGYCDSQEKCFNDVHILTVTNIGKNSELHAAWRIPFVRGDPPAPRLAHSSSILRGNPSSQDLRLVIFGGIGYNRLFNDVSCLEISNIGGICHMNWVSDDRINITGLPPTERYGHTASVINETQIVIVGGMIGPDFSNDIYVLSWVTECHSDYSMNMIWSRPKVHGSPPMGRARHSAVVTGGEIYILGGRVSVNDSDTNMYSLTFDIRNFDIRESKQKYKEIPEYPCYYWKHGIDSSESSRVNEEVLDAKNMCRNMVVLWNKLKDSTEEIDFIFSFGPHNGRTFCDVRREHPRYIYQLIEEVDLWKDLPKLRQLLFSYNSCVETCFKSKILDVSHAHWRINNCFVIVSGREPVFTIPTLKYTYGFRSLVGSEFLSDMKFVVKEDGVDEIILAHKCIVMSRCKHLNALLSCQMSEANLDVVRLPSMSKLVLITLLIWMYTGSLEIRTSELLLSVAEAACEWRIDKLILQCEWYLIDALDIENASSLMHFAEKYFLPRLLRCAMCLVLQGKNWEIFCATSRYQSLSSATISQLEVIKNGKSYAYKNDRLDTAMNVLEHIHIPSSGNVNQKAQGQ